MPDPTPAPQTSADFLALVQRAAADAEAQAGPFDPPPDGFLYSDSAGAFWVARDLGTPCRSFAEARAPARCLTIPWGDLLDLRRQAFAEGFRRGRAPLAESDKPPTLTPMARPDEPSDEPPPTPGIVRTYTARTHVGACGVTTVDGEIRTFTASRPIAADGGTYGIGAGGGRREAAGAWPSGSADSPKRVWRDLAGVHAGQPTTLGAVLADLDALAARARAVGAGAP